MRTDDAEVAVLTQVRRRRVERALQRGLTRDLTPPPPAAFASFGRSVIVPPARVDGAAYISVGNQTVVPEGVWLSVVAAFPEAPPRLRIGSRVVIGRFVQISVVGSVTIEDDVLVGDQAQIGDTFHVYDDPDLPATQQVLARPAPVRIGAGAMIGPGAIVLPGVTVGEAAIVRGESVITRDVPPGATVGGNPARSLEGAAP